MKTVSFACLLTLIAAFASADTLGEENQMIINAINATDFEVIRKPNMGPHEFWCGAATFNEVRQRRSETLRIYLKRAWGPSVTMPGREGVVFSMSDEGLPPPPDLLFVTVEQPGATLKSAQARRYCRDAFTRSTK